MARPGGKRAGRVSVLVIPDATKFRESLKLLLKRVEQSMSANLMVTADTRSAEATIRRFQKDWNGKQVQLAAGVTTAAATAQLRLLSRPRVVPLHVRVSQASVKRAATIIASLGGIRVAGDLVQNLSEKLQNLDRALPKIAVVSQSIAGLSALLISAIGGAFTLGGGLLQVFGAAAALPGILTGMAVGGTVFALALSETGQRLADLKPDFVELKSIVTENFWDVAERPIRKFINSVLPGLRTGFGLTATAIGNWSSSVVASFQNALGGGVIDTLFGHLVDSIDIASTGTAGFAQALVTLGGVGATFLPRLAQWTADLSNRFNEFITRVAGDGSLKQFIEDGITAGGHLFDLLQGIGSTFAGITRAAEAAGGGGLASAAALFERIAEVVNGPVFQTALTTIFEGAAVGASGLAAALGPIGATLAVLAPLISEILSSSGATVGKLLGDIAKAAQSPVFQKGLSGFFEGLQRGLLAIGPALPAIADAFGTFLGFAGSLAEALGPVLGAALEALAPIFTSVLTALEPMLPLLGGMLVDAIRDLAPSLLALVTAVLPLLPELIRFIIDSLPLTVQLVGAVAGLAPVLLAVITAISGLLEMSGGFFDFLGKVITFFADGGGSIGDFAALLYGLPGPFGDMLRSFGRFGQDLVNGLVDAMNGIREAVSGFANWVADVLNIDFQFNLANIPHVKIPGLEQNSHAFMASGGDVLPSPGGTRVTLAEAGEAETVVNRGAMNRMIERINARLSTGTLAASGGDQVFNVYPPADEDPRVTARAWAREFSRQGG